MEIKVTHEIIKEAREKIPKYKHYLNFWQLYTPSKAARKFLELVAWAVKSEIRKWKCLTEPGDKHTAIEVAVMSMAKQAPIPQS